MVKIVNIYKVLNEKQVTFYWLSGIIVRDLKSGLTVAMAVLYDDWHS